MRFLLIMNVSCLIGLKSTSHCIAHRNILLKSSFRVMSVRRGFSTMSNKIASSANRRMFPLIFLTMSLIKRRNINGPKIDPCGTPAFVLYYVDVQFHRQTLCCLLSR